MFCDQAKEYLSQKGITFQEKDIAQDPDALADLNKIGFMTTPVIVFDGAVIVGFDSAKIDKHAADLQSLHFPKRIASVENAPPDAAFWASASSPVMVLFPENLSTPMSS